MSYLNHWDEDVAARYDTTTSPAPEAMISLLAELAGDRAALEFAIGTGRVALPLAARGVAVHGIEYSEPMANQLRAKPGGGAIPVTIGDMATTRVPGEFGLVYLIFNTIMNVTTQDAQVACFENAAAHLTAGGHFVIELIVPKLRVLSPDTNSHVFVLEPNHIGVEEFTDFHQQIAYSHHWFNVGGELKVHSAPYRYAWPSELDLMARIAGLTRVERWADWDRSPFTGDSTAHISVWQKT
jgi:SAM-dependent methyltransferase